MTDVDPRIVLEIVKWPLALVIFGIIALLIFKGPLTGFVNRLKGFRLGKWLAGWTSGSQSGAVNVTPSPADELLRAFDNALLRRREDAINADLQRIASAQERQRVLVRYLGAEQVARAFDRLYYLIYGSQIAVLQLLMH